MITRAWFVLPPAQEYYYRNYHIDYQTLPPFKPGCGQEQSRLIDLIYPEHGAVLYLPTGFSGQSEQFVFKAAHARPEATLYWHVDEPLFGRNRRKPSNSVYRRAGETPALTCRQRRQPKKILFEVK